MPPERPVHPGREPGRDEASSAGTPDREPAPQPDPGPVRWRPFAALRYRGDGDALARMTIAPPDHWDDEQVASFERRDPHNVVRLLAPVLAADGDPAYSELVGDRLQRWLAEGVLGVDPVQAVYVYRCSGATAPMTGVVAAMSVHPQSARRMLPHEGLIASLVQRQTSLARATNAQLEPVVAVHRATAIWQQQVAALTSRIPDVVTETEDDVRHEVWVCSDASVADAMAAELVDSQCMIADGHHRWAALQGMHASDPDVDALVMLVDIDRGGLGLGPIHRVLRDLTWARVEATGVPAGVQLEDEAAAHELLAHDPACCVLSDGRRWLGVPGAPGTSASTPPEVDHLAVTRLHDHWIELWGCAEQEIQYVHDSPVATMLARRDGGLAVLLPTLSLSTVFAAARGGAVLPRKATSFGPKPRIGVLMQMLHSSTR